MRSRLFIKYLVLFVAVVSLVLIANGAFDVYFSYKEQKASLVRIQREQAEAAADKIGQFISEIESQVGWTTQLPWSAGTLEQRRFDALRLLRQVPAITELAEIDSTGHEQLKVSRLAMEVVGSGADVSKEPAFTEAVAHKVFYGPVYFRRKSEPYMTLSLAGTRRDTRQTTDTMYDLNSVIECRCLGTTRIRPKLPKRGDLLASRRSRNHAVRSLRPACAAHRYLRRCSVVSSGSTDDRPATGHPAARHRPCGRAAPPAPLARQSYDAANKSLRVTGLEGAAAIEISTSRRIVLRNRSALKRLNS